MVLIIWAGGRKEGRKKERKEEERKKERKKERKEEERRRFIFVNDVSINHLISLSSLLYIPYYNVIISFFRLFLSFFLSFFRLFLSFDSFLRLFLSFFLRGLIGVCVCTLDI